MAEATVNIPISGKYGFVEEYYPNSVFPVQAGGEYRVTPKGGKYYYQGEYHYTRYHRYLYFTIAAELPANLKYNRIYDVQMTVRALFHQGTSYQVTVLYGNAVANDFDPRTLTWNTKPASKYALTFRWYPSEYPEAIDAFADILSKGNTHSPITSKLSAKYLRECKYFMLEDGSQESFDDLSGDDSNARYSRVIIKPELGDGSMPYITVTYDDEEVVTGQVAFTKKMPAQTDQGIANTVKWEVNEKENTDWYCVADSWEQTSAVLRWREQGAATWNEIQIAGNTKEYTFPARTFGSNKTYEYYIEADDVSGGSSETAIYTFTTPGTQVTPQNSPTSGYANPREPVTFEWTYSTGTGSVAGGATTLHWRESGEQTWNDVSAAAGTYSVTIPANTFSILKTYEWYLSGEDTYGYASSTEIYTFTTSAAQITSIPAEPVNSIEDKNEIIHFAWTFASDDGAPSSRSVLQYKRSSDATWTTLADLGAEVASYDAPAATFDAGAMEWRAVPYNIDEIEGTGASASFISYGAPVRPTVFTDGVPFLTVMWQAEEQESYQIMVDDESYGPYFGSDKRFTLPSYLEDGEHTVKVRTMGVYGLWSKWGETSVTILNEPGESLALAAESGLDISLSWETEEETADFLIYRNGALIGRTNAATFRDRMVLGTYSYTVINRLPSGNYSISNGAAATAMSDRPNIALLSGGNWVAIEYSKKGQKEPEYDDSTETVYNHLAGNRFPSVFLSGFEDSSMSFSALFLASQEEDRKAFENMFGQPVVMKMRDGTVFVGVLAGWKKSHGKNHWTQYEFTIRHIEWEDYRDDTQ